MNDNQVVEELSKTDAYAPGTLMPAVAWSRDAALSEIERRIGMEPRESTTQAAATSTAQQSEQAKPAYQRDRVSETQHNKTSRGRMMVGFATAVLVLIAGFGAWLVVGGDSDVAVEPEVAVVLSAIEARNSGDIDAYKAVLTGDALLIEQQSRLSEALSYANRQTELVDCHVTGNAPGGETIVECQGTETDDFYSAGGIMESGTATFLVTDDGRISSEDRADDENRDIPWEETEASMFNVAFFSWLMEAHPVVFEDIYPVAFEAGNIPGIASFLGDPRDPAEMLIAVDYVAEFVAQSDVYPLN